jgi:hypothetical protein
MSRRHRGEIVARVAKSELIEGHFFDRARTVGRAVDRAVVHDDQDAVARLVYVELENVCAIFERLDPAV